ncbi:glycine betaine ABC transporter substrate-binding protein [Aquibacillus sediminis]|uniref:glycine betaine ABC transporter substrate-binding protein n=1 Tax=Aquibacillus sediminis TaxID=2574734 RepID=UPI001108A49D|nr:glycine betaine ABC transporter substrate-binding protein [Aquibacillus sediminis]
MQNKFWKKLTVATGLSLSLIVAGCGTDDGNEENDTANNNEETESVNVGEATEYTITGIEPGAGISVATEKALEEYENLAGWNAEFSSTAAMATELGKAIDNEEPIVVTGWIPHWKFAQYDLKFLEDPEGVYGETEGMSTLVRQGLEEEMPGAYTILDRFNWGPEDMQSVMLDALDDSVEFDQAAQDWIDNNSDKVAEWTEGVEDVDGQSIELALTPWDSERASGNVVKLVLESKGYDVTMTPVDPAPLFEAIATGDADATVAPWLPLTHGDFYEEYKDEVDDLGQNLDGAKIGVVVPEYMDIDSIEDLEPAG